VTLALAFKAQAIFVMPIVFGGAPVVNTLLTSYLNKSFKQIKPMFLVGMAMVAIGMIGVFLNKPQPKAVDGEVALNWLAVGLSIALAVLCWGSYGPFLHIGQSKMGGSRLRPFCCVGIAYFLIAVIIPVVLLESMAMRNLWRDGRTWDHLGVYLRRQTDLHHAASFRFCSGDQHHREHRRKRKVRQSQCDVRRIFALGNPRRCDRSSQRPEVRTAWKTRSSPRAGQCSLGSVPCPRTPGIPTLFVLNPKHAIALDYNGALNIPFPHPKAI